MMKRIAGLMLKDFYELISAGKTLLVILVLYLTVGQIFFTSIADVGMLICAMLPVNTIGYDERSGWNRYVLSFPVSRKEIVVSKYILGYLLLAAAFAVRLTVTDTTPSPRSWGSPIRGEVRCPAPGVSGRKSLRAFAISCAALSQVGLRP